MATEATEGMGETDDLGIIFSCHEQQWQRLVSEEILIEVSEVDFCVFLWGRGGDNLCIKDFLINWKMGCVLVLVSRPFPLSSRCYAGLYLLPP